MHQPLHVAHLHTGWGWGGGEHQVALLVRALSEAGTRATLWARRDGLLLGRAAGQGLPARPLPGRWRLPFGHIRLCRDLERGGIDLLHCHDSQALALGIRVRRRLGLPLVLSRRVASPLRRNPVSRAKYSARHIDAVVAVSATVRDVFCRGGFPEDRVFVAPSGLDLAYLDSLDRSEAFRASLGGGRIVVGIGKLAPKKNWPLFIRTAAAATAAGLDASWLIVGDGPDRRALESLARGEGLASIVRFLGFRDDAARILRNSDLLLFPSIREGAPGVVREAMALGVPVVAADAAGTAETLDGHGWLVSPDEARDAARAVIGALTDADLCGAVTRAAQRSARERFAFDRTRAATEAVYARVAGLQPDGRR